MWEQTEQGGLRVTDRRVGGGTWERRDASCGFNAMCAVCQGMIRVVATGTLLQNLVRYAC